MGKEALLIVDMSNDFVADHGALTAGKPAQQVVPYIKELATKFLADDHVVVVTMDAHQLNDPHFELWAPHKVVGTEGLQLYGDLYHWFLNNLDNENLIYSPKTNSNAFLKTGLAEKLSAMEIEKVHAVGVCTDICIFNNCRCRCRMI